MRHDVSDNLDFTLIDDSLETADVVARTAHIWIRSICLSEMQKEDERHALAVGLVAGLCERLELNARVRELVAYVYTLLDNEGGQALAVSRMMLKKPVPAALRQAHERGRSEATGIVEMLIMHDRRYKGGSTHKASTPDRSAAQ
jgi:hypothetical protein